MPLYTYRCETCGVEEDKQQTFKESETYLSTAPFCPDHDCVKEDRDSGFKLHSRMRRVISPTNFSLKGKGWFKDGYR